MALRHGRSASRALACSRCQSHARMFISRYHCLLFTSFSLCSRAGPSQAHAQAHLVITYGSEPLSSCPHAVIHFKNSFILLVLVLPWHANNDCIRFPASRTHFYFTWWVLSQRHKLHYAAKALATSQLNCPQLFNQPG